MVVVALCMTMMLHPVSHPLYPASMQRHGKRIASRSSSERDSSDSSTRSGRRPVSSKQRHPERRSSGSLSCVRDTSASSTRSGHRPIPKKHRSMPSWSEKKARKAHGITVGNVSFVDGKRVRDKRLPCFICTASVSWLARHLDRQHSDNFLVAQVMAKTGIERKDGLKRLKNLGAFNHNVDVLKKGYGELVVARRTTGKHSAHSYLPCSKCYGFFLPL